MAALASPSLPVLVLERLTTALETPRGRILPVAGVDLRIGRGMVVGLVGESGSGKSMTALSLLRLVPRSVPHTIAGHAFLAGTDLLTLPPDALRRARGERVGMIFQNPATSLDPVFTVGNQLAETLRLRGVRGRGALRERSIELLAQVRIPDPEARLSSYPWELSGGMQQRVMIALALAGDPELLIADEPTTALDVTIQVQVLDLILHLVHERGMSVLLITHDLAVVAQTCDEVAVMYTGRIVERAPAVEFFARPLHPYAEGLLESMRHLEAGRSGEGLAPIPGQAPDLARILSGCTFRDRCRYAMEVCRGEFPPVTEMGGREVRCYRYS